MMTANPSRMASMGMSMPCSMMNPAMMANPAMMPAPGMMVMPTDGGMAMMPRCRIKMEKTATGMVCVCECEDKASAAMLQSLCMMAAGQMLSCCLMCNGQCCMMCHFALAMSRCEMTEMGCRIVCTCQDPAMLKMMHGCCDACMAMCMPGMMCCLMLGGMPVCCMVC